MKPPSRLGEPRMNIEVGEEPTTCVHCGTKTDLLEVNGDGSRIEECPNCEQQYVVTDVIEDEETGERIPAAEPQTPILDKILAEFSDPPEPTFEVEGVTFRVKDIKIDTYRASSGMLNKVESGVRITHIPTGLAASNHDDRSQRKNKVSALKQLAELIKRQRPDLAMPEASQEELNHLFGIKPSPYPEFGSF